MKLPFLKKLRYRIILAFYISFIFINIFGIKAVASIDNSYFFVMKDMNVPRNILSDIKINYPQLELNSIDEIGVFTISSSDDNLLEEARSFTVNKYKDIIESSCRDQTILLEGTEKTLDNSEPEVKEKIGADNKYEVWRWDIDRVTNNRNTYNIEQGNHDVKIGIIDSGIDAQHPDLKDNIVLSKSCVPGKDNLEDSTGHGTMVAGEIAANGNVKGVAPKAAIASYKVFDGGDCESSWVISAIIQATKDNMDVINLSLGTYKSLINKDDVALVVAYERAILYAQHRNCVVVSASGNEVKGLDITDPLKLAQQLGKKDYLQVYLPGGLPNVITVSAINRDDKIAYYSNYGSQIDIAAPGGDYGPEWESKKVPNLRYMLLVTTPTEFEQSKVSSLFGFDKGYEFVEGGTSFAAPKVSAAAALLIAHFKDKYGFKPSALQVEQYLYDSTDKCSGENSILYYGNGILNVEKMLKKM